MVNAPLAAEGAGLGEQWPLIVGPLAVRFLVAAALFRAGPPGRLGERWERQAARIPDALERLTGIPGWAAAVVGLGLFAAGMSVVGLYTDIAWHIQYGRDKAIWSPPHVMIFSGISLTSVAAVAGVVFATVTGRRAGFRWGRWQVPWSVLPVAAFGSAAGLGFGLDDLWHAAYGIDVTLWSPTHILLIGAGSLSTVTLWMTLREADVPVRGNRWGLAAHGLVAGAAMVRLSYFQAEFDFGVPQFQLLFHPVIVALTAATGLVAARLIMGPGGALIMTGSFLAWRLLTALAVGPALGYLVPRFPLYIASALAVEVVAAWLGTQRPGRMAVAAGVGVGTVGLAGEWWWSQVWGRHPWDASLWPQAVIVAVAAAIGGAVFGAVTGAAAAAEPVRFRAAGVALAAAVVVAALAVPSPRLGVPATADVALERRGDEAVVTVALDRPGLVDESQWFEILAWQGGDLVRSPMVSAGLPGVYRSDRAVPVSGDWKTIVRLHRHQVVAGVPVYLPDDPEVEGPPVPAEDGRRRFVPDTELIMREARAGAPTVRLVVYAAIAVVVIAAMWVLGFAARRLRGEVGRSAPGRRPAVPAR